MEATFFETCILNRVTFPSNHDISFVDESTDGSKKKYFTFAEWPFLILNLVIVVFKVI